MPCTCHSGLAKPAASVLETRWRALHSFPGQNNPAHRITIPLPHGALQSAAAVDEAHLGSLGPPTAASEASHGSLPGEHPKNMPGFYTHACAAQRRSTGLLNNARLHCGIERHI